jgi:hypothetical protein
VGCAGQGVEDHAGALAGGWDEARPVSLSGAFGLLRRHFIAVLVILLIAAGVGYSFKHTAPTYAETGTMVFLPPTSGAHPNAYAAVGGSLLEAAGTLAASAMSPQEQQMVQAQGGTTQYDVELLNSYNLQYPNFSNAYLVVTTTSTDPVAVHRTYNVVTQLLNKQFRQQQAASDVAQNNRILIVTAGNTRPLAQPGSSKRALIGLAILTIVAVFGVAAFLDKHPIRLRKIGSLSGAARPAAKVPPGRAVPD